MNNYLLNPNEFSDKNYKYSIFYILLCILILSYRLGY